MSKDDLLEAIRRFYGNTSIPRSETREGLEEARDDIDTLIESLLDDDE